MAIALGIDVGATGVKGALVDIESGKLVSDRVRYKTPKNATPQEITAIIENIVSDTDWHAKPFGIGLPSVVKDGVAKTAVNIHKDWIDYPIANELSNLLQTQVSVLNDADAAAVSEMKLGAARDVADLCVVLTLGTGIGSALVHNGKLMYNTELGSLIMHGNIAEKYAANSAREKEDLDWKTWALRVNEYLEHICLLLSPRRIVISGGVSKKFHKYESYLNKSHVEIVPAQMLNNAGIIGAAIYGQHSS